MKHATIYISMSLTLSLGLLLVLLWLMSSPSTWSPVSYAAGPWYVAPGGNDDDDCLSPATSCATINGAIAKANSLDTIYVATGVYTGTGNEVTLLYRSVTLSGGWDSAFTTQSAVSVIDGEGSRQGIKVNNGVMAAIIERFTVQNGTTSAYGGGIYNEGTLTLNDSTVSGNTARWGGGISNYGGTLIVNNCTVNDNAATDHGGGIHNNHTLTLNSSTVSGNQASQSGGGMYIPGGTTDLNNSTISGNRTGSDGGGIYDEGTLTLNSSTVSSNTASGNGGGIHRYLYTPAPATLQNTIVADNTASGGGPDCDGNIGSSGYNLIEDTSSCAFTPTDGDLTNTDPLLGPLEDSPGYHPLLPGSSAIDAGNPAGCTDHLGNPLLTDQRGMPRVGRCDIGAYEFPAGLSVTKQANADPVQAGAQLTYTIRVNNTGNVDLHATITDTLPTDITLGETSGGMLISPGRVVTWTPIITTPSGVWMETVVVTVALDYVGPLINVVEVTTNEGAVGGDSVTVRAGWYIHLPLVLRVHP